MPDIAMCQDKKCPLRKQCHRFTATPSAYQSYFMGSPRDDEKCEYFWPAEPTPKPKSR